jgi:alanyl-tRNA synthetase
MDANTLRRTFTQFFVDRGHLAVASGSLVPQDSSSLFTNSGMMQFVPYFLGTEKPPALRATTVQKCVRAGGKHNDLDDVGRTLRHLTFFEMLGNFSFGDYFKPDAIPYAWDLVTNGFGLDPERLWVTVHLSDDDAEAIWRDVVGVPAERIQRLDKDNFWQMGDTGPCGPCSEIFFDKGPAFGADGGPAHGGDARFMEIWNLVFMQFERRVDGTQVDLPKKNIDTGAGLERILSVLQGKESVYDTDVMRPIIETMESVTGQRYGGSFEASAKSDFALRVLAEHSRTMTFLINDGVYPSNDGRGYVLRRIIRRAVRQAFALGVDKLVAPAMIEATLSVMGEAYPELHKNRDLITATAVGEEERFRKTLKSGLTILDESLSGVGVIAGATAFQLHDTFGFPIELTTEIAEERGASVDRAGFDAEMQAQRDRAKAAQKVVPSANADELLAAYRTIVDASGQTEFVGYTRDSAPATVVGVVPLDEKLDGADVVEVFLDVTPFYAESGGQIGDAGTIASPDGSVILDVVDTTFAVPGLRRHRAVVRSGQIVVGDSVVASINVARRNATRRNHTATHILHWALRQVLGVHVRQQGSYVGPDRLRFDFSHHAGVTAEEISQIEALANREVLSNLGVETNEMTKAQAESKGAIAFFGDKYGERVRVLQAGANSIELCGGTHVGALGDIGVIVIVSESSIGAGIRRIEALTGEASYEYLVGEQRQLREAAEALRTQPSSILEVVERVNQRIKSLETELSAAKSSLARAQAGDLLASAVDGRVVARVDGLDNDQLRDLATTLRDKGANVVVLASSADGGRVLLCAAVTPESGQNASGLLRIATAIVGGGGGKQADLALAGGKDVSRLDEALDAVRAHW